METIEKFTFKDVKDPVLEMREKLMVLKRAISYAPIIKTIDELIEHTILFWEFFDEKRFEKPNREEIVLTETDVLKYLSIARDFSHLYCDTVRDQIGRTGVEFFVRTHPINYDPYHANYDHLIDRGIVNLEDGQISIAHNLIKFIDRFRDHLLGDDDTLDCFLGFDTEKVIKAAETIHITIDSLVFESFKKI